MSEVERYWIDPSRLVQDGWHQDDTCVVKDWAYDRVVVERDAALVDLSEIKESMAYRGSLLCRIEAQRDALHQRLTAADEVVDAAIAFVTRMIECASGQPSIATGYLNDILDTLKPAVGGVDEPNCLLCLDKKTVPSNLAEGYVMDCPDCCGEEG